MPKDASIAELGKSRCLQNKKTDLDKEISLVLIKALRTDRQYLAEQRMGL
jgi:hypothetical protein